MPTPYPYILMQRTGAAAFGRGPPSCAWCWHIHVWPCRPKYSGLTLILWGNGPLSGVAATLVTESDFKQRLDELHSALESERSARELSVHTFREEQSTCSAHAILPATFAAITKLSEILCNYNIGVDLCSGCVFRKWALPEGLAKEKLPKG